jgi:N-carbamoyl-L-amino-acid hydrolase
MTVDVRDTDEARRDRVLWELSHAMTEAAQRRSVRVEEEIISVDPPAVCAPAIVEVLEEACRGRSLGFEKMVSRAYHDSLFVSRFAPTGMVFIPCRGGVSHRPDEYASPEAIGDGVTILTEALAKLSLLS